MYGEPGWTTPKLGLEEPLLGQPILRPPQSFLEGAVGSIAQGAASLSSPMNLAILPLVAPEVVGSTLAQIARPVVAGLFGGLGAKTVGQSLGNIAGTPNPTPGQYGQAVGDTAQGALMTLGPVAHMVAKEPMAGPQPYSTEQALKDLPSVVADLRAALQQNQLSPARTEPSPSGAMPPPSLGQGASGPVTSTPLQQPVPVGAPESVHSQPSTGPLNPPPVGSWQHTLNNLRNLFQVSGVQFGQQGVALQERAATPPPLQVPYVPIRLPDMHHAPGQQQQPKDAAPVAKPVESGVAPVKPGTEQETMFLHDLRGFASFLSGAEGLGKLSKEQVLSYTKSGSGAFDYYSQTGDLEGASKALQALKDRAGREAFPTKESDKVTAQEQEAQAAVADQMGADIAPSTSLPLSANAENALSTFLKESKSKDATPSAVGATATAAGAVEKPAAEGLSLGGAEQGKQMFEKAKAATEEKLTSGETIEDLQKQMEQETGMNQLPLDNPIQLQGPRLFDRPKDLGFNVGPDDKVDSTQLYNRLKNVTNMGKLAPAEFDVYDKAALKAFLDTKPTMSEVGQWMKEKGPRVQVHEYGMEGKVSEARQEYDRLSHEYDSAGGAFRKYADAIKQDQSEQLHRETLGQMKESLTKKGELTAKQFDDLVKFQELRKQTINEPPSTGPRATTAYKSVSPFDTGKYPVKRVDVVLPLRDKRRATEHLPEGATKVLWPPDSIHEQLPNTLGWAMMQYKDVGGVKTAVIGEVQSRWGQWLREVKGKKEYIGEGKIRKVDENLDHPLLRDYNRLILKATIAQALRDGARRMVLSDSKTAMMTEGHDLQVSTPAVQRVGHRWQVFGHEEVGDFSSAHEAELAAKKVELKPQQEPGMRLNYDRILPQIMEELTGGKGEKVDLGEHKNAFDQSTAFMSQEGYNTREAAIRAAQMNGIPEEQVKQLANGNWGTDPRNPRSNLIFLNADNTPKTTVTGLSYDLAKVDARKEPYSLMGRDKVGGGDKTVSAPLSFKDGHAKETIYNQDALERLKLPANPSVHDALSSIAQDPRFFGKQYSGLAKFLTENFPSALKVTKLLADGGVPGRAHYRPYEAGGPTVHLSLGDNEHNLPFKVLHEAAHAATYWAFEHPKTEAQHSAVATIKDLRAQALGHLTDREQHFLNNVLVPQIEESFKTGAPLDYNEDMMKAGVAPERGNLLYTLANDQEFIGGLISDQGVRRFLNSVDYQGKSAIAKAWTALKSLLGIKADSIADRAFDALRSAGEATESDKAPIGADMGDGALQAPPPGPALVRDMNKDEFFRHKGAFLSGWSAPRSVAVSQRLGNELVSYASSRIAAPLVARSLATEVLGTKYKDANFNNLLGSVIVEDQLRGVKKGFMDAAALEKDPVKKADLIAKGNVVTTLVGQPYTPFRNEAGYQRILNHPDMLAAIDRFKRHIMPIAEQAHVELGGKLAQGGEQTGAFANLMAIVAPDDIESTRSMLYGSKRGDITNQLRKGSAFSKERKGTAWMYDTDFRKMAERMIRGNWEQKRLRDLIAGYEREGVAVEQKAGQPPPTTLNGKKLVQKSIELRGAGLGQTRHIKLWLRSDLASEFEQAVQTDSPVRRAGVGLLMDAVSDLQIMGPTDAAWHTANMFAAIGSSQGGPNLLADLARKIPGIQQADALGRVIMATRDVLLDHPEVQKELAQIAEVGAGRSPAIHKSLIGKGLAAVGAEKLDPSYWSAKFINLVDKGGRVTLNRMYDNLVDRGLADGSDLGRREFINKMGQYNRRLSGQVTNFAKDWGVSPFVTAGKNFNRLALQKLMMSPGVANLNPRAAMKMRAVEAAGALIALYAFPTAINYLLHGSKGARPGVPVGAIDTGKDTENGKPLVIDPLQTMLYRRGIRIAGGAALDTAVREKLGGKETVQEMSKAIIDGQLRPWEGPVPRGAYTALKGYDPSGYLQSRNPNDMGENVKAALTQLNPSYAAFVSTPQEGKVGGLKGVAMQSIGGPIGVKEGRYPSMQEKTDEATKALGHEASLGERVRIASKLQQEKEPNANVLAERKASVDALWRDFARQDRLHDALPLAQQQWLDKNKLHVTGFQSELSESGIRVPMTRTEGTQMEALFSQWYAKGVANVMKNPAFDTKSPHMKQLILDKTLDEYRKVARQVWEALVARGGK